MTVQTKIKPAGEYVNYYASYMKERAYSKRIERLLSRSLDLLEMECGRRERRGEDVAHIRAFVKEARR